MNNAYPLLSKAIQEADLVEWIGKDGKPYPFKLFQFGEKGNALSHQLINEIKEGLVNNINSLSKQPKYIVTITEIGTAWGMLVANVCNLSMIIGRNNQFLEKDPESFKVEISGPHGQEIYFKGIKSGDTVVILDDVVSTAKNITAVVKEFQVRGIKIAGVITIVTKGESHKEFEKKFNISVKALFNLTITGTVR